MNTFTGTARLIRLVIRLDRTRFALWTVGLSAFMLVSGWSLTVTYPDQASVTSYTTLFGDNPALIAFAGPGYGFDDPNLGVVLVNETHLWGAILFALMGIFLVNRHTRAEEDVERADLLRSSPVGAHAPTAAALLTVVGLGTLIATITGLGFVAFGYSVVGSVAIAASFAACGAVFVGITAVVAQVASGGRATLGVSSAILGVAFVLRALGDIGDNALRWLSPIGWAQGVRAFAGERWWPLALSWSAAAVLVVVAFVLASRRDLGSGMLPQRPGRPSAPGWVRSPLGLAIRLQRGFVLGWIAGAFVLGTVYGSIGEDIEQLIEDQPEFADFIVQVGGVSIADAFLATSLSMLSVLATAFVLASCLRLRSEEAQGRAEPILAASIGRVRWAASHLAVAAAGGVFVMLAAGLGMGVSFAAVTGDGSQVGRIVAASVVTLPSVYVLAGVAMVAFGWFPRHAAVLVWGAFAASALVVITGDLLRLPGWTQNLAPMTHTPAVPARPVEALPLLLLGAVGFGLVAAGLLGWRRRDLQTS